MKPDQRPPTDADWQHYLRAPGNCACSQCRRVRNQITSNRPEALRKEHDPRGNIRFTLSSASRRNQ